LCGSYFITHMIYYHAVPDIFIGCYPFCFHIKIGIRRLCNTALAQSITRNSHKFFLFVQDRISFRLLIFSANQVERSCRELATLAALQPPPTPHFHCQIQVDRPFSPCPSPPPPHCHLFYSCQFKVCLHSHFLFVSSHSAYTRNGNEVFLQSCSVTVHF
jgi:hypothetical protein